MAQKTELPDFTKKRKILFGEKVDDSERYETGCEFMQTERFDDALEFFARTETEGVETKIRDIAARAMEDGNTPLFLRAKTILKEKTTQEEMEDIARVALSNNRPSMALIAYQKGGMDEKAETLRNQIFGTEEKEDEEKEEENAS